MKLTYLQYLHTDCLPFPRSKRRSISRALLLFTTGLVIGATCVVASPGMLAPGVGAAFALAGAGGVSSSSDVSETSSRSISSSSTGAGWTTSPYSQRLHCLKQNRQGFRPLRKEKPTAAALTRLSLSHSGGRTVLDIKIIPFP